MEIENKYPAILRKLVSNAQKDGVSPQQVFEKTENYIRRHPSISENRRGEEMRLLREAIEIVKSSPEDDGRAHIRGNTMTDHNMTSGADTADSNVEAGAPAKDRRWMNRVILALAVLTLIGAGAFWQLRRMVPIDDVVAELRQAPLKSDGKDIAKTVSGMVKGRTDQDIETIAKTLVDKRDPVSISQISESLIATEKDEFSLRAAALIAEAGAVKYNDGALLNRAGLEYQLGRWVKKDYVKAAKYLDSPPLAKVPHSQFYLGQVLIAKDNPKRDEQKGMEKIRFAASEGLEAAKKLLAELEKKAP